MGIGKTASFYFFQLKTTLINNFNLKNPRKLYFLFDLKYIFFTNVLRIIFLYLLDKYNHSHLK